jgi:hypothetical protein
MTGKLTERQSGQLATTGSSVPKNQVIKNVEDMHVALKAYLLAVRFEKNMKAGDDNEFHIEVGATPQWEGPHEVVEVTTGNPS